MSLEPHASPDQAALYHDIPSETNISSPDENKTERRGRAKWGRVLPEPRTNIPPRRRAKTADEREQRMVERVLRNRRSAHNSRERKKIELERLQQRVVELEQTLKSCLEMNHSLVRTVEQAGLLSGISLPPNTFTCAIQRNGGPDPKDAHIPAGDNQAQSLSDEDPSVDPMGWLMGLGMTTWSPSNLAEAEMVSSVHAGCTSLSGVRPDHYTPEVWDDMQEYDFAIEMFDTNAWMPDGRLAD
ncbi:basic region leucine zipper [Fusarium mexicanum]|uniref:Basic region leucine zipper n=1 Tax=Fusarium mexicanum TaxID=751941 RepID=A0A8H5MHT0_9HYPO|nr:basic region leucine zipper [Fusarium mexicanum]